ncbi:hypothetical protein EDD18DRAFT_1401000 [Armillaria luteobubalina]|uniref:Uncharacterized protein n=1 Tax=Armillaria luteobubalina TaxID=153913 RepID=A0AA39Q4I6_9AGAR|nr:hypothetical protein EDD18DRAFT_1401000 [Armillaria luteobubalina]
MVKVLSSPASKMAIAQAHDHSFDCRDMTRSLVHEASALMHILTNNGDVRIRSPYADGLIMLILQSTHRGIGVERWNRTYQLPCQMINVRRLGDGVECVEIRGTYVVGPITLTFWLLNWFMEHSAVDRCYSSYYRYVLLSHSVLIDRTWYVVIFLITEMRTQAASKVVARGGSTLQQCGWRDGGLCGCVEGRRRRVAEGVEKCAWKGGTSTGMSYY